MTSTYELLFLKALCITVLVEAGVVIGFTFLMPEIKKMKLSSLKIAGACVVPSSLTLPYFWFLVPVFFTQFLSRSIGGEIAIFLIETLILKIILDIPVKYAVLVSFCANCMSIIAGLFILR
jgi:uncharacterized protein YqhQ